MTVDEALEWFERGLVVKQGLPEYRCQTGETYVVYGSGGLKPEGAESVGYESEDLALRWWLKHALIYKTEKTPDCKLKYTLYWRHPVRLETAREDGKWYTYARFIITDKEETHG